MTVVCLPVLNVNGLSIYSIYMLLLFGPVYDVSSKQSFTKLDAWLSELETFSTKQDMIKMLVGNKIDKVCGVRVCVCACVCARVCMMCVHVCSFNCIQLQFCLQLCTPSCQK